MKKVLPLLLVFVLLGVLALAALSVSTSADTGDGPSVCLQWATVTPQACFCEPVASATIRVRPPISPNLSLELSAPPSAVE